MAYKWPEKDPDEQQDFSVDWSRFLGDNNLSSALFSVEDSDGTKVPVETAQTVDGLQFLATTTSGNVATARFAGGTNHKRYNITCRITTTQGLTFERTVILPIWER